VSAITTGGSGLDIETLEFVMESLAEFARRELPDGRLIELDERDEFPEELVRRMCGEELGVQLLFVAEEYGGMGGCAFDVYRVCEQMARVDLGIATTFVPRLIELCFQTAGVWEIGTEGRMALPTRVAKVTRYAGAEEPGRLYAVATPGDGGSDVDVVDELGRVRIRVEGYRTIELPGGLDADALAPIRAAMDPR
jgi:hypothetical protein